VQSKFQVTFLETAVLFLEEQEPKAREKIIYNIRKAQVTLDGELFKKITPEIWEFRTLYNKTHYRLFAFWDKRNGEKVMVVVSHGIIKKTNKTPNDAIEKAEQMMRHYFKDL
jgi:phage-related protein